MTTTSTLADHLVAWTESGTQFDEVDVSLHCSCGWTYVARASDHLYAPDRAAAVVTDAEIMERVHQTEVHLAEIAAAPTSDDEQPDDPEPVVTLPLSAVPTFVRTLQPLVASPWAPTRAEVEQALAQALEARSAA